MKRFVTAIALVVGLLCAASAPSYAATEKEKAFVDSYKKAFESKDANTLKSFLYTKGADPMILEFYTMMLTGDMGGKISSIELKDLTPEDVKKVSEMQPLPDGKPAKLPVTPTKKLVVKVETASAEGSSTSTSESFVAEVDGKLMIPVPGPAK